MESLRKKFEEHVKKAGLAAVSKLVGEAGANIEALDPKVYVDALLEVHKKNSETVSRSSSFKGEAGFVASLDKTCQEFVNRNHDAANRNFKLKLLAQACNLLVLLLYVLISVILFSVVWCSFISIYDCTVCNSLSERSSGQGSTR